jgi:hypothetical protein
VNVNKYKHPLDEVLGFQDVEEEQQEDDYELVETQAQAIAPTEPIPDPKDEDDIQTDKRIDAVYDAAMTTFQNQMAYTEIIEPRYAARNAEVAHQFLNTALTAAATKAKVKSDRKKTNAAFIPYGNKTTNNVIVADRNELLRMMSVDGEVKEIKK